MNIFSIISAVSAPHDLWTILINWMRGAIGNYGWTILLFTILVKLIMSPLDFMVKYQTKKQTLVQKKCSPQIAKIRKKFGANQQQVRIQTQAIYQREGIKMGSGCIFMLLNMVLTMVVFFTLFSSLRKVSAYETIHQYEEIEQTYDATYISSIRELTGDETLVDEAAVNVFLGNLDSNNPDHDQYFVYAETATKTAANAAVEKWNSLKDSWLWVDNIWVADATTAPLPTYDGLVSTAKSGGYKKYVEENIDKEKYTAISSYISTHAERSKNGYFILPIMVGLLTFLTQWVTDLHNKLKNKKAQTLAKVSDQAAGTMKMMKIIMPLIMVMFAFTSSTSFGIYLLASSIAALAFGEVITLIINKLTKKQQAEVEEVLEKEANRMIKKGMLQEK